MPFRISTFILLILLVYSNVYCHDDVIESRQLHHRSSSQTTHGQKSMKLSHREARQLFPTTVSNNNHGQYHQTVASGSHHHYQRHQPQHQMSPNNRPPMIGPQPPPQQQQQQQHQQHPPNNLNMPSNNRQSMNNHHNRPHPGYHQSSPSYTNTNFDSSEENDGNQQNWPSTLGPEQPRIIHLDVKCEKNFMKVNIEFDKPFNGLIFSKQHYSNRNCVYLPPNTGRKNVYFDISINSCGTTGNALNGNSPFYNDDSSQDSGMYFENTIVVQYDPQVQEAWDQARKLRCTWHDQYEKAVSFRPFPVDMLDVVRADFAGDNVGCWMQIQVGKGPWASEVAGIVKIGQTMTMVLAIKDEENKFDMLVRNCVAHDTKRQPIELVDSNGCVQRPKLMSKFTKIKNFGSSASVLSYAHFKAFKFPDAMEVHFQCTIQICRFQCPDQCSSNMHSNNHDMLYHNGDQMDGEIRKKRGAIIGEKLVQGTLFRNARSVRDDITDGKLTDLSSNDKDIGLDKIIRVVSPRELSFELSDDPNEMVNGSFVGQQRLSAEAISRISLTDGNQVCLPKQGFIGGVLGVTLMIVLCTMITFMLSKRLKSISSKRSACKAFGNEKTLKFKMPPSKCNSRNGFTHSVPYLYDSN